MKKKTILIGATILAGAAIMVGTLNHTNLTNGFIGLNAEHHTCSGNHYNQVNPSMGEYGVKEYWVCCECNQIYYSTRYITNYDAANWNDNGTYTGSETATDDRKIDKISFDETAKYSATGFSAAATEEALTITSSLSATVTDDYKSAYLTDEYFYDVNLNVNFSNAPTESNAYFGSDYSNSLIIGGQLHDTYISGWYVDVCSEFTVIYEVLPNGTRTNWHHDNALPYFTGAHQSLSVSVVGQTITISNGVDTISRTSSYYYGGHIGFYSRHSGTHTLSISNLSSNVEGSVLTDATYANDWQFNEDCSTFTTVNDGYVLSGDSYKNVKISISMTSVAQKNLYGAPHHALNSLIIGGGINESGYLTGYVVEFQQSFLLIGKLSGTDNITTGDALNWIGREGLSFDIEIKGNVITYTSGSQTSSYTLTDYNGGKIGFLANRINQIEEFDGKTDVANTTNTVTLKVNY